MTRAVLCSHCGETVREISRGPGGYAGLDGCDDTCPRCDTYGVYQVEADDDGVRVTFQAEDDPSPDCRCETCPQGGPYTCIDTSEVA